MNERITTAGVAYSKGLFLVAQRLKGGPLSEKWEFIGGKNRWGETVNDTLKREWLEELSLTIEPEEFLLKTEFDNNGTHYILYCHKVQILNGDIKLKVHQNLKWVTPSELETLSFGPSDSVIKAWIINNLSYFQ